MGRRHLVSAALRHLRDAEHLVEEGPHQSVDQALHLVGFASECVRKGGFDEQIVDHAIGHDVRDGTDAVVDFLVGYDPEAHRYGVHDDAIHLPLRYQHWRPDVRYEATGAAEERIGVVGVRSVIEEARTFTDERVEALWCDGIITVEALR